MSKYFRPLLFVFSILVMCFSLFAVNFPTNSGSVQPAQAINNGLAKTPPMGWNSWNKYHCGITEATVKTQAKAMHDSGLQAAGYQYVVIDDCWAKSRASDGTIQADPS